MTLRGIRLYAALIAVILFVSVSSSGAGNEADSATETVTLELDHVYVCVAPEAPEARLLQDAGLRLAKDTAYHTGQGTASVFFFFENVYLELFWIDNMEELEQADKQFAEKLLHIDSGGSPIGLGLRRTGSSAGPLPFVTRSYFSEWMMPGSAIEIAEIQHINEPEIFVVPPYMAWDSLIAGARNSRPELLADLEHEAGMKRLTCMQITGPGLPMESEAVTALIEQGIVEFGQSDEHAVELTFDEGSQGKTIDARPDLPIIIHY